MSAPQEQKMNLILDAAFELFGRFGFYETKISDIADQAGIAKGTIYLYFTSKEELFKAMLCRDFERFMFKVREIADGTEEISDKLYLIAEHHLLFLFSRKDYARMFFQFPNNDPGLWKIFEKFHLEYIEIVYDVLLAAQMKRSDLMAKAFTGLLDGFKMDMLVDQTLTEDLVQQKAKWIVRMFLYGSVTMNEQNEQGGEET